MAVRSLSLLVKGSRTWCQCRQMSNFTEDKLAGSVKIALIVTVPAASYLVWKYFLVGEEEHRSEKDTFSSLLHKILPGDYDPTAEGKEKPRWNAFERLWLDYWHEDPEECERQKFKHLRRMEKRRESYLRKKAEAIDKEVPLQPMDLFSEIEHTYPAHRDSGIEN